VHTDAANEVALKHGSPECALNTGSESTEFVVASPAVKPGNWLRPKKYVVPSRSVTVQ
jgi:hypothetical protein